MWRMSNARALIFVAVVVVMVALLLKQLPLRPDDADRGTGL